MRDTDLAYLAGQMGADGTICLVRPETYSVRVRVSLYSQDKELLDWGTCSQPVQPEGMTSELANE